MKIFEDKSEMEILKYRSFFQMQYDVNKPTWSQYSRNFYNLALQNKLLCFEFLFDFIICMMMDIFEFAFNLLKVVITSLIWAVAANVFILALTGIYHIELILPIWIILLVGRFCIFVVNFISKIETTDELSFFKSHFDNLANPWTTFWASDDGQIKPVNFVFDSMFVRDGFINVSDLIFNEDLDKYLANDKDVDMKLNHIRQDIKYKADEFFNFNVSKKVPAKSRKHY